MIHRRYTNTDILGKPLRIELKGGTDVCLIKFNSTKLTSCLKIITKCIRANLTTSCNTVFYLHAL